MPNRYSVIEKKKKEIFILFSSSSRFPYDRQRCTMKFGTWTYDSAKVNLKFYRDIQQFDLEHYVKSNEWTIITNNASRHMEKYGKST